MKIKHFAGYGTVEAKKINDGKATLHVHVEGNHECGLRREDDYDLFNWLVKRFDRTQKGYQEWHKKYPVIEIVDGWNGGVDCCDYYFRY